MARLNLFDSKERFVCIVHSFVGAFKKFLTPTNFVVCLKADLSRDAFAAACGPEEETPISDQLMG